MLDNESFSDIVLMCRTHGLLQCVTVCIHDCNYATTYQYVYVHVPTVHTCMKVMTSVVESCAKAKDSGLTLMKICQCISCLCASFRACMILSTYCTCTRTFA